VLEIVQQSHGLFVGEGKKLHHDHSANVAMRIDPIIGIVYPGVGAAIGPHRAALRAPAGHVALGRAGLCVAGTITVPAPSVPANAGSLQLLRVELQNIVGAV